MGFSVARWHMSTATFGRPNFGLGQTTGEQFQRGIGDRGSGEYKLYNPTDGNPVQLNWEMDGPTFNSFVTSWNTTGHLRWGNNWFTLDLPLMLDYRQQVTESGYTEVYLPISVLIGENVPQDQYGYRAANNFGSMKPQRLFGRPLDRCNLNTTLDNLVFSFFDGAQLPTPNETSIQIDTRIDGEPLLTATWNAGGGNYAVTNLSSTSTLGTLWPANLGTWMPLDLIMQVTNEQRYVCHFVGPYRANKIGYDMWNVSAQLEIDLSPYIPKTA